LINPLLLKSDALSFDKKQKLKLLFLTLNPHNSFPLSPLLFLDSKSIAFIASWYFFESFARFQAMGN
jgi:hypothetical protein